MAKSKRNLISPKIFSNPQTKQRTALLLLNNSELTNTLIWRKSFFFPPDSLECLSELSPRRPAEQRPLFSTIVCTITHQTTTLSTLRRPTFPYQRFFSRPFALRPLHAGPLRTSRPAPGDIPILSAEYRFCGILRVRYSMNFRRIQLLFQNVELDYRFCRREIKRHGAPEIIGTGTNERAMGKSCLFVPIFHGGCLILYGQRFI